MGKQWQDGTDIAGAVLTKALRAAFPAALVDSITASNWKKHAPASRKIRLNNGGRCRRHELYPSCHATGGKSDGAAGQSVGANGGPGRGRSCPLGLPRGMVGVCWEGDQRGPTEHCRLETLVPPHAPQTSEAEQTT